MIAVPRQHEDGPRFACDATEVTGLWMKLLNIRKSKAFDYPYAEGRR
jgi:hypothetical protein